MWAQVCLRACVPELCARVYHSHEGSLCVCTKL